MEMITHEVLKRKATLLVLDGFIIKNDFGESELDVKRMIYELPALAAMVVYPRTEMLLANPLSVASENLKRLQFGIPHLDKMMGGGRMMHSSRSTNEKSGTNSSMKPT